MKDENVGWKHTCSACSHAGFERIGSRSGYNPVQDIYILQRSSSCDPHFRYSEFLSVRRAFNLRFRGITATCLFVFYNPCEIMALMIGTQLGPHEIVALLGKGGMGEVYRARDTKLKRDVAIKILPDEFSEA